MTDSGQKLAESKGIARRTAAIALLLENTFFDSIMEKFGDKPIPIDSVAVDYLQREEQLNDKDAEGCWSIIKENLMDFSLIEESAGKQIIIPKDVLVSTKDLPETQPKSEETGSRGDSKSENKTNGKQSEKPLRMEKPLRPNSSSPQIAFNIQVVLPENADADTYDAIFKSISKHLLNSQGSVSDDHQD